MGKKLNRDREKILSKTDIKTNNILKAVKIYEVEDSELLIRRAAVLFLYSPFLVFYYIKERDEVRYLLDSIIKRQKLTPIKKTILKDYIYDCFQSGLSLTLKLFREYADELCRAKGDDKEVEKNWYLGFYERYISIELLYARSIAKERVFNKNTDNYIVWFRLYELTVAKWNILLVDTHNMDESGYIIEVSHKSRVIILVKAKEVIKSIDDKREWVINIDIISGIKTASKGFFVIKGKYVFRDLMDYVVESGCTIAVTDNGWFNDLKVMNYIKHFDRYTELIGDYRLLVLDGYGSHVIFQFRKYAYDSKIILLYLPAYTTHKLQLLNVGIFGPQADYYSQEVDEYF